MTEFLVSLAAFVAAHALPARTGLRAWTIRRIGHGPYMAGYSVLSLALVTWIVSAATRAPFVELWPQASWQAWIPVVVMPAALALLAAGLLQSNPLSITLLRTDERDEPAGIVRVTRHPALWGFGLWGLAHIPPNGDVVSVILFAGLGTFAFAGMAALDRHRRRQMGDEPWAERAGRTSVLPFRAILAGRNRLPTDGRTLAGIGLGIAIYLALLFGGHSALFGVDPLAPL